MNTLGHSNDYLSSSAELARAAGGRLGAFSRAFHMLRERVLGEPPYKPEKPASIAEEAEAAAELAAAGTIRKAGGNLADTSQHHMLQDARAEIDDIFTGLPKPEPSSVEDLFPK